jgi:hypothetical protein
MSRVRVFTYATAVATRLMAISDKGRVGYQSGKPGPTNPLCQANFKKTYLEQNTNFYNKAEQLTRYFDAYGI